ncbi:MAG: DUF3656 domain-containing protein, partial [Alphaproteobacteria bacterium]|nr:DUF3656 domain-containing protein [Alphaproteobacteria bacterium]
MTDYYRQILDGKGADSNREERIKQIFSRPWCKFHFAGKDKNVIDRNFVGHRGLLIGKVEKITHHKLIFKTNHKIARFDGLQLDAQGDDKPFGFSVQKLYVNHKNGFEAKIGDIVEIDLPPNYPKLSLGDKIYLASSTEVKGAYHYDRPKENLYRNTNDIFVNINVTKNALIAKCGQYTAQIDGNFMPTDNPQKSSEAIQKAFAKTGDTNFNLKELHIENPENLFTPASLLNELRRQLYAKIQIEQHSGELPPVLALKNKEKIRKFKIKIDNLNNLHLLNLDDFAEIIYLLSPHSDIDKIAELPKNKLRLALPAVCRRPNLFADIISKLLNMG